MNLLTCPFCGHTPTLIERFTVKCDVCDAEVNSLSPEAYWNTRADCWRPIEEGPKDGTIVLAILPGSDVPHSVFWDDGKTRTSSRRRGWAVAWDHSPLSGADAPTHFMPLPNPPKK